MPLRTWLFLLLMCPLFTWAATTNYQGSLIPSDNSAPPIPLRLDVEDISGFLMGNAQMLAPVLVKGRIASGNQTEKHCSLNIQFANRASIQLEGDCVGEHFEGNYFMQDPLGVRSRGNFRLTGVKSAASRSSDPLDRNAPKVGARSLTTCITEENTCLRTCPQTDFNSSNQCIDMCKRKKGLCMGKGVPSFDSDSAARPSWSSRPASAGSRASDSSLDGYR